ncbi:MAG: outer membrane beta-barrel protein [Nitrospira sp.]|nr:outer membrane beta-barrel protein [Nitrospira sp.]
MNTPSWVLAAGILTVLSLHPAASKASAAEAAPTAPTVAKPPTVAPEAKQDGEKTEWYVSIYLQGSRPLNRPVRLQEDPFANTDVQGGLGGGLKVGFFPAFTGRFVGLEAELSGLDGKVNAPTATTGGVTRSANFRLQSINAMANVLLRYPGEVIQPYIGVGAGLSGGFARDLNLQHTSIGTVHENAADGAFAYQFIGGLRANVGERLFLFTEYKYFVANYQWESELANGSRGPSFTLNSRMHVIAGGIGFHF